MDNNNKVRIILMGKMKIMVNGNYGNYFNCKNPKFMFGQKGQREDVGIN